MKSFFSNCPGEALPINDIYASAACFLILSGPSLKEMPLEKLRQPGIVTIGVNNSPAIFRPNIWVSVDDPANFAISIWKDPLIQKFVMHGKRNKPLWDNTHWQDSSLTVAGCPNVIFYRDNEHFRPEEYLDEDTINWGNHTDRCECGRMRLKGPDGKKESACPACGGKLFGSRSVALAAVKIAYVLGFRKVFILGADFSMGNGHAYAWKQDRSERSIRCNNDSYSRLNMRFGKLRPIFERRGFHVFNATPNSGLEAFIKIDFSDAIEMALSGMPETKGERVYGMYERKAVENDIAKNRGKVEGISAEITRINGSDKRKLKRLNGKLQKAELKLRTSLEAKERLATWTA